MKKPAGHVPHPHASHGWTSKRLSTLSTPKTYQASNSAISFCGAEGASPSSVTMRSAASTGTARADGRPSRRSCNPSTPSVSSRPLQRRHVRSVIPHLSAASTIVSSRRCRRPYRSSNRIRLTSCRTLARVIVALLEGAPSTGQMMCYLHSFRSSPKSPTSLSARS